ncbi:hypothetical protein AURDEDRAFT_126415 [Auricularia subglabra TFB-10046 SS5]|nr:hypothetical protein AURDEDRAFT_126415 [Auricularia subglabra TFB-10046 SS5]
MVTKTWTSSLRSSHTTLIGAQFLSSENLVDGPEVHVIHKGTHMFALLSSCSSRGSAFEMANVTSVSTDEYGSFDPRTLVKGTNTGMTVQQATPPPTRAVDAPRDLDASSVGPGIDAALMPPGQAALSVPTDVLTDTGGAMSTATDTGARSGAELVNGGVSPKEHNKGTCKGTNDVDSSTGLTAGDEGAHEGTTNTTGEATSMAADKSKLRGTENTHFPLVLSATNALSEGGDEGGPKVAEHTEFPRVLFDVDALVSLAKRIEHVTPQLAKAIKHTAPFSVIMDTAGLQQLQRDYEAACRLAELGEGVHEGGDSSMHPAASSQAIPTPPAQAPPATAAAPPNATAVPTPPAQAPPATTAATVNGAANGAPSGKSSGRAPAGNNAAKGAAKGSTTTGHKGGSSSRKTTAGASGSSSKKTTAGASRASKPAAADEDAGALGDSEDRSDDEDDDDEDENEEAPLGDLLSSVDEVQASLEAAFKAIEDAGPRESNSRPSAAQLHALARVVQHVRDLTGFAASRLGFSQERVLRNVADMVPARLGNQYNTFRSFLKCTDADYAPRRELDQLLGCKSKYTTAEYKDLYKKLHSQLGQEKFDELLLAFDIRYPYGVTDPTVGDRERTFHGSVARTESLFRYFAGRLDIEGFFCVVGANSVIDNASMTHWFATHNARRFLRQKLFMDEPEICTYLQTDVQDSVNNTRAAEKLVARGRTLPLFIDINDALGRTSKTAPAPQQRRKGRGTTEPKFNETYFDVVEEFPWSDDEVAEESVPLLSGRKDKLYVVSLPWPTGYNNVSTGIDYNWEFTVAELEIAIIKFRELFAAAGIPLPKGRGFPLAAAFQMLIRRGFMFYGWPVGIYIFNESRKRTQFAGLGWPMKCLLIMYILCDYIGICKSKEIPVDYLHTLPPLPSGDPFRMVCITDAIPKVKTIDTSFHGTHRAFFDNEIVIGLHTSLVSRVIPTMIPRPTDKNFQPWKGVHAWNEARRKENKSTVDSDDDIPFTPAHRAELENAESDGDQDVDGAAEGEDTTTGKAKGKAKGATSAASRKKSHAGPTDSASKPKTKRKKAAATDGDGEGVDDKQPPSKKPRGRQRSPTPDTEEEQQRLRDKAMRRRNLRYDDDISEEEVQLPGNASTPAGVTGEGADTQSSAPVPAPAGAPAGAPAPPARSVDNGALKTVKFAVPPSAGQQQPAGPSSSSAPQENSHQEQHGREKDKLRQSPRRSQRSKDDAAAAAAAAGGAASAQKTAPTSSRKTDAQDSAGSEEDEGGNGDGKQDETVAHKTRTGNNSGDGDEDDDEEVEHVLPSTSRKKAAPSKPRGKAAPRKAASKAPPKAATTSTRKRKRTDEGDDEEPPSKRVPRDKAYSKFTNASRVPKTREYDFLFTERKPLTNQGGILMKPVGKTFALPQDMLHNEVVVDAVEAGLAGGKIDAVDRAVLQYLYDVWPLDGSIRKHMLVMFTKHCKVDL